MTQKVTKPKGRKLTGLLIAIILTASLAIAIINHLINKINYYKYELTILNYRCKELERVKEEYQELSKQYNATINKLNQLMENYTKLENKYKTLLKALRNMTIELKVAVPYKIEGNKTYFKYTTIDVQIPRWKYLAYYACLYYNISISDFNLDPDRDEVLYEIVNKVRNWLINNNLYDEERLANALISIAQLVPYNESGGGYPVLTLVEGGMCGHKADLAVALLRIAGYDAVEVDIDMYYKGKKLSHAIIGVHLLEPPKYYMREFAKQPCYIVWHGKRYYVAESVILWTIGTLTSHYESVFAENVTVYGESPEEVHFEG